MPICPVPILLTLTFSLSHLAINEATSLNQAVMRAHYQNLPAFRDVVDKFWSEDLSEEGRDLVRASFSGVFDSKNEAFLRNEFQASLLEANAEDGRLGHLVPFMRKPLLIRLREAGVNHLPNNRSLYSWRSICKPPFQDEEKL